MHYNKSKSSGYWEHKSGLRITAGIQVSDGQRGGETHLAEKFVVSNEYALNQTSCGGLES
jgi:hypothetical protein